MERHATSVLARSGGTSVLKHSLIVSLIAAAFILAGARGASADAETREAVYRVELGASQPAPVNALQLAVEYPTDRGRIVGLRTDARCAVDPNFDGHVSFNHCATADGKGCPEAGVVHIALVSLTSFLPSQGLIACDFASALGRPDASDFTVRVVDATRQDGSAYVPVEVTAQVARITSSAAAAR
jgi:hypothetical protein